MPEIMCFCNVMIAIAVRGVHLGKNHILLSIRAAEAILIKRIGCKWEVVLVEGQIKKIAC